MKPIYTNNALATLATTTLSNSATSIILSAGTGDQFPAPMASEYALLTLFEIDASGKEITFEIVRLTSRTADTLTVERNAEAMVGAPHAYPSPNNPSGIIYIAQRWTADSANKALYETDNLAAVADKAVARQNLGLEIGVNVQAFSAKTAAIAALTWAADRFVYFTGAATAAIATITAFGRGLLGNANSGEARTYLGLAIGTDVQAFDANTAKLNISQTFTKPQSAGVLALTDAASWDASASQHLTADVDGGIFTVANPDNLLADTYYALYVEYTTSHGLAFGSDFVGISSISPTAAAGAHDHFIFRSTGSELELVAAAYDVGAA